MFGLNDNKDQKENSATPGVSPVPADIGSANPATNITPPVLPDVPTDTANIAPPANVITPTAPPLEDPLAAVAVPPGSIPVVSPPVDVDTTIKGVNLGSAYIASEPPDVSRDIGPSKPTAASLISTGSGGDLIQIKQQALQNLAPLVNHLDQTPEEKFKTTLMLIQASDNSSLIKEAYEAANQITDEKTRAQALLDIVNEINYFTQQANQDKKVP